jgi:hypothetical protein
MAKEAPEFKEKFGKSGGTLGKGKEGGNKFKDGGRSMKHGRRKK